MRFISELVALLHCLQLLPEKLFQIPVEKMNRKNSFMLSYLSMFSMSVHTTQDSCGKSTGDDERSSSIGTSELSSTLQSMFASGHTSFP